MINSALPFSLLTYATLSVTAGFASILNATSPLWRAIVAFLWLRERLTPWRIAGLAIGFAGVLLLAWGKVSFKLWGAAFLGEDVTTQMAAAGLVVLAGTALSTGLVKPGGVWSGLRPLSRPGRGQPRSRADATSALEKD